MSVHIQLFSGIIYDIEIFESCRILNLRRMLGIQLRQNGWGNHFNDDLIHFYSDDYQPVDDALTVEENELYHAVIRDDYREDPEILLSFENGDIVFREFHSRQLLATNNPNLDDNDSELLQHDCRVSWFSPSYRSHLSVYREFLINGINSIREQLISHLGNKQFTQILNGRYITRKPSLSSIEYTYDSIDEENNSNYITFVPGMNSDFNLIRLYIQIFFPFQIVGNILILE